MPWCEKSFAVVCFFVPVPFLSLSVVVGILRAVPERGTSHSSVPAISCVVHFLEWGAATDGQGRHAGVTMAATQVAKRSCVVFVWERAGEGISNG